MALHKIGLYRFFIACNIWLSASFASQPQVTIFQGIVRGSYSKTRANRQFFSFEGIPYAKPPVGELRFKEPAPANSWIGIYNATSEPQKCLQLDMFSRTSVEGVEDCLYLNVFTPKLPEQIKNTKLFDVIAFIHGGAFYVGKSGLHGPSLLLDRDIVLVTFNYRIGPLGFLSTGDNVVPGNNALKDQALALKWIQKNIAAFGGDPNSVTLGGMSAGGASCHYHVLSPLSKGLFKGAICMSGVATNPWTFDENPKEKTIVIAKELGCPIQDSHIMIECLRNRPGQDIISASKKILYWLQTFPLAMSQPVVEPPGPHAFIADLPLNLLKQKCGSDIPLLLSFVQDEGLVGGSTILTTPGMVEELLNRWDELIPYVLDFNGTVPADSRLSVSKKIKTFYNISNTPEGKKNLIKMIGDRLFVSDIGSIAKLSASVNTSPVYLYRFSYRGTHSMTEFFNTTEDLGVSHGDDAFYTVGFLNANLLRTESDLELSKQMLDVWVSFASNGTLTGKKFQPVRMHLPKLGFTDIEGPSNFQVTVREEVGEDSFWDSLGLKDNIKINY